MAATRRIALLRFPPDDIDDAFLGTSVASPTLSRTSPSDVTISSAESPSTLPTASRNSLHYVDTNEDGEPEIAFGSSLGFYVTR